MLMVGEIPRGFIGMYSGAVAEIPGGWALCDGSNGTPDLRGRFVTGAGGSYAPGDAGGSADAVVVAHDHGGSTGNGGTHNHGGATGAGGSHSHQTPIHMGNYDSSLSTLWTTAWGTTGAGSGKVVSGTSGSFPRWRPHVSPDGNHNHGIGNDGNHNHNIPSAGVDGAGKNLPPYVALAYIMKL